MNDPRTCADLCVLITAAVSALQGQVTAAAHHFPHKYLLPLHRRPSFTSHSQGKGRQMCIIIDASKRDAVFWSDCSLIFFF